MPVTLKTALADKILTESEATELAQATPVNEVDTLVDDVQAAVNTPGTVNTDTLEAKSGLNKLLSLLDTKKPLNLDHVRAKKADGSMDWLSVLRAQASGSALGEALPAMSFSGKPMSFDPQGRVSIGGNGITLDLSDSDPAQLGALFAMARPGQTSALSTTSRAAFVDGLLTQLDLALPAATTEPGKYRKLTAAAAALSAVSTAGATLSPAQIDKLLALYAKQQAPLAQALILRALDSATLTEQQKTIRDAWTLPDAKGLLGEHDKLIAAGTPGALLSLTALAFARNAAAQATFYEAAGVYNQLNPGVDLDIEEITYVLRDLEAYVDGSTQSSFVYGSFREQARKNLARYSNAKLTAALTPVLSGDAPKLGEVALTQPQAAAIMQLLPGLKDAAAASEVAESLLRASALFGETTNPVGPAAFALFQRIATSAFDKRHATRDGMLDTFALAEMVDEELAAIRAGLEPRWAELSAEPASFDGISLDAETAAFIRDVLQRHLRSQLSVDNLGVALAIVADKHGGALDAQSLPVLHKLIDAYRQNWPNNAVFDFNKLGRMAGFIVQGKDVPLCTVDGKAIPLGEFYVAVGQKLAASIDDSLTRYDWMADRMGIRARTSVELLDVLAQQTAEGDGPIALLSKRHPGKEISVIVTAKSGAHEEFLFDVKGVGKFNQSSDGAVRAYTGDGKPVLFTASIATDGTMDVKLPQASTVLKAWPLQTTYAVGDVIDIRERDSSAAEAAIEGKPFSTRHRLLPARITGFDAAGNYTVSYRAADGNDKTAKLRIDEIEKANNPHDFALRGSLFSDVYIDIDEQPHLAAFLAEGKAIIDKHLPRDGRIVGWSPAELAKAQRACVAELQAFTRPRMLYPTDKDAEPDEASAKYHEIIDGLGGWDTTPLDSLVQLARGVCRHQCILEQLLLQTAGIDSRLASGAANTAEGDFRGYHIWNELSLADGSRDLSDQTWNDASIPLWNGAYDVDKRRVEMYNRTARYDAALVG